MTSADNRTGGLIGCINAATTIKNCVSAGSFEGPTGEPGDGEYPIVYGSVVGCIQNGSITIEGTIVAPEGVKTVGNSKTYNPHGLAFATAGEAGKIVLSEPVKETTYDVVADIPTGVTAFTLAAENDWIELKPATGVTFAGTVAAADGLKVEESEITGGKRYTAVLAGPAPVDPTEGDVKKESDGSFTVEPKPGVKSMTLTGVKAGDRVNVPTSLESISGVAGATIVVKNAAGTVIPTAAFVGGAEGTFSLALNETAVVTVDGEQIPVKPALTEATDDTKPLVVGDTVAVGVKAIPGLTYSLMRSDEVGGEKAAVASTVAEGARVSLTDPMQGGKPEKAFYVIQVAK